MVIRSIRIGSMEDVHQYDDADYSSAAETDQPIKAGTPIDGNDVVRLNDLVLMVDGPGASTDEAIARFDGVTGTLLQDSSLFVNDSGDLYKAAADLEIDCGANKTVVLSQVVYDDLRIFPGSFDRPGISDPTIVAYDVNGGGVSTYLWQFDVNNIASFVVQLPHSYKQGTDITVHIHWTPGPRGVAENGKFVGWKVDYSWANINANFPTMLTADLSDACDGTNHKHQMTPEATIDGHTVSKNISSVLLCNVKRTDTGADDTWVGTISGERPMLLEIDFHFQIDTVGSRQVGTK
jgi:hypothetical protein